MSKEDLIKKVQTLAANTEWTEFMKIVGEEHTITILARVLRHEGKSWLQIAKKLEITVSQARTACKNLAVKK